MERLLRRRQRQKSMLRLLKTCLPRITSGKHHLTPLTHLFHILIQDIYSRVLIKTQHRLRRLILNKVR